ncbi:hypothetical protein L210DRAFT_3589727 [Boletus edulis BED1]|nr:hypothetical protein L210DRAFT_3589727 [Boletus edulis BED1]
MSSKFPLLRGSLITTLCHSAQCPLPWVVPMRNGHQGAGSDSKLAVNVHVDVKLGRRVGRIDAYPSTDVSARVTECAK